jgi:hypothetical protein
VFPPPDSAVDRVQSGRGAAQRMSSRRASIGCVTTETLPPTTVPDTSPVEVIHLGGEAAVVVPVADFLRLQALERHASSEELEEAEIEATLAAHRAWVAAGRPGAVSHEEAMAELLGGGL